MRYVKFCSPPVRLHCCRRRRSPPTCRSPPPLRAAAGRGFRWLVPAWRYRLQQSEREAPEQCAGSNLTSAKPARRFQHRRHFRPRRRLPVQQLAACGRHGRISRRCELPRLRSEHLLWMQALPRTASTTIPRTKSEWLVLANAYVDLGTWWCITPFVGAGVGAARVSIANYTDVGQTTTGGPSSRHSAIQPRSGISPGPSMRVLPTRSRQA